MPRAGGGATLPDMDPNVVIFFALEGYAVAAALILFAVLAVRGGEEPGE